MRWLLLPAVAALLVAACSPRDRSTAAGTRETGMSSDTAGVTRSDTTATAGNTAQPTPSEVNPSGATGTEASGILSVVSTANQSEIQAAKDAQTKASNSQVKRFAAKLAQDHQKNEQQAEALAKRLGVDLTAGAGASSESQSAAMGELAGKTGADFDRAYVEHEIQDHQQNIDKIEHQLLPAAKDPQVKAFLQKTDREMKNHLQMAKQLEQQLSKSSS
jgi:putative membrane protein